MKAGTRPECWIALISLSLCATALDAADIPRTQDGRPDLSGTYDVATITPLQRPREFGDSLVLTEELARAAERRVAAEKAARSRASDPERGAPPAGGDGSTGAAGNVGGYNTFWIDNGEQAIRIDGQYRTSILTRPANGRHPPLTPEGRKRAAARRLMFRQNRGDAWWLDLDGPGPYDDPESRTLSDRCLLGFGSTGGPPMLPVLYNNLKRIVQTPDHVMILVEMVHDARVIRLGSEHADPSVRRWLGDHGYHGDGPIPEIPVEVRSEAARRYIEAFEQITARAFEPNTEEPVPRIRRSLGLA